ncbi:hypothetical protein [Flaviflagellibacter deserti]|jgi:hypothetical protein|uniref:Holin n=1 Tax=Flaviflagellibacter deserti TaxID=2267266 RepID=A0ABV9Z1Y9_9HYPH
MNLTQLQSVVKTLLTTILAYLVGKGWIADGQVEGIVAAAIAIVAVAHGFYVNRAVALVGKAASLSEVEVIQTTPKLAQAVPSDKVIPA